jgi:glycosyltransferase 2 family protein
MRRGRAWKIAVSLLVSAVALWATLRHVDATDLARAVASARPGWLLLALGTFVVMFALRAARWAILLGGTPFWTTFHALNIGYLMNSTLPLRVGELGRSYVVSDRTGVGMARALSSVVVERAIDLASVVLLFAAYASRVPMPPAFARAASLGAVAVVVAVVAGATLLAKADAVEALVRARLGKRGDRFAPVWDGLHEVRDGLRAVGSARRLGVLLALTVAIWGVVILVAYLAMAAFLPPDGDAAGLVVVAANLGGALPSAPGGLGVVQAFAKTALIVPFHLPEDPALAFVLVWSLGSQLASIALGLIGLGRLGTSLGAARRRAEEGH